MRNRAEQEKDREFKLQNASLLRELDSVQNEVDSYIAAKIDDNLSISHEKLENVIKTDEEIKEKISAFSKKIRAMDDELSGQETKKLDLLNNLELIDKESDIKSLSVEVSEVQEKLKNCKHDELIKESNSLKQKKEDLEREVNIMITT